MSLDYSYRGFGQFYLRNRDGSGGLMPVGNASKLNFGGEEESETLLDYTAGGGGIRNQVDRVSAVTISAILHDLSPSNLAIGMYGSTANVAAGSVSEEVITAHIGALSPLTRPGGSNHVVQSSDLVTTYTAGTDYEIRRGGVFILEGGAITDDASLKVSYDFPEVDVVQALVNSAQEYELLFEGLNEARSGKPVIVQAHRVKFGFIKSLDLIGDSYAGIELGGAVLSDPSQGEGLSKFFKTSIVK